MPTVETFERDALGYFIRKRPGAEKPYGFDWSARLPEGVNIVASEFEVSAWSGGPEVAADRDGTDGSKTWIWIQGGEIGWECEIVNRVTFSGGNGSDERRARIKVVP